MKTFKFLALAAAALLTLGACSKEMTPSTSGLKSESPILFESPVVNAATRAAYGTATLTNSTAYPTTWNFDVAAVSHANPFAAWSTSTSYFAATTVSHTLVDSKGAWTAAGLYWPVSDLLSFQAYSPAAAKDGFAAVIATDGTGVQFGSSTAVVTLPNAQDAQVDLLFSERVVNKQSTNHADVTVPSATYYGIQIPFHHALSSICFTAKTSDAVETGTTITLTGVTLKNVANKGYFAQALADNAGNGTVTNMVGTPVWNASGVATDIADWTAFPISPSTDGLVLSETACAVTTFNDVLVMPQTWAGTGEVGPTLTVTYTIKVGEAAAVEQSKTVYINTLEVASNPFTAFEIGKQYTFNIIVGLNKIYFAPTVSDWVGVTITDATV